ncbi:coxsackievirus and adenovirus receptor homolog [Scyliorhinus torazame]|uniref:coxsackievirus and adenovirus receptor homolog n=1 Tax=Scyliorhinus torazame TaxID=75743 RepID=UPI003B5AD21E
MNNTPNSSSPPTCTLPPQAVSNALKITSTGSQTVYVAEHDDIQIGCTFQLEPADKGALDIEWSIMNPDTTQLDRVILTYQHGEQFAYDNPLRGRFQFTETDPSNGNASVRISTLRITDTNTFQCKVKQAPGIDSRKVTVGVHVRPQEPECWTDRSGDRDQDVTLHCVSHRGSSPLTYTWNRVSDSRGLPARSTTDLPGKPPVPFPEFCANRQYPSGRFVASPSRDVGTSHGQGGWTRVSALPPVAVRG